MHSFLRRTFRLFISEAEKAQIKTLEVPSSSLKDSSVTDKKLYFLISCLVHILGYLGTLVDCALINRWKVSKITKGTDGFILNF
jgi:hypothetical protein